MFPYARKRLAQFIASVRTGSSVTEKENDLIKLKNEFEAETLPGKPQTYEPLSYLEFLMDQDKKSPALKSIQGQIWEEGFKSGEIKGELFPDVPAALERWRSLGLKTYIYSSGSVLAQKLLFQFSVAGNLTCFLYAHFDTAVGAKIDSTSYQTIAKKIYTDPSQILFISDAPKELRAATAAGMQVRFSERPGNIYQNEDGWAVLRSFEEI